MKDLVTKTINTKQEYSTINTLEDIYAHVYLVHLGSTYPKAQDVKPFPLYAPYDVASVVVCRLYCAEVVRGEILYTVVEIISVFILKLHAQKGNDYTHNLGCAVKHSD